MTEVNTKQSPGGWGSYWETLRDRPRLFREQAWEYVRNLESSGLLEPQAQVLDFGCGFGFVAERLAPLVGKLYLWDASANMRQRAQINTAGRANVRLLNTADLRTAPALPPFDLILVNSVVQYLTHAEFSGWLSWWRAALAPSGRIVVSDLIRLDGGGLSETMDVLRFSARRGFLLRALGQALLDLRHYRRTRQAHPLTRLGLSDLTQPAGAAELEMTLLPRNLTHFPQRLTAVFQQAARQRSVA